MSMKKFPFMPMYWGEYFAATKHLNTTQSGAYLHLIGFYWCNGKLPQGEETIRKITGISARHWATIRAAIAPYFDIVGDGQDALWTHKRVRHELSQALEKTRAKITQVHRHREEGSTEYPLTPSHPSSHQQRNLVANACLKNGKENGSSPPPTKPRHGQRSPRGRIWFDRNTMEFEAHAEDYRNANHGLDPPMQWHNQGAWFEIVGEA